jgi:uncharacterized membrane protein YoaK (UPF0700 family)
MGNNNITTLELAELRTIPTVLSLLNFGSNCDLMHSAAKANTLNKKKHQRLILFVSSWRIMAQGSALADFVIPLTFGISITFSAIMAGVIMTSILTHRWILRALRYMIHLQKAISQTAGSQCVEC